MPITTSVAIFFLIWWVVLFMVLPWGIRSQHESGGDIAPGTDPGAPAIPNLWRKLGWTTLVSAVIFAGCYLAYAQHLLTFGGLMGPPGGR